MFISVYILCVVMFTNSISLQTIPRMYYSKAIIRTKVTLLEVTFGWFIVLHSWVKSEYDQEIPQSHTVAKTTTL